MTTFLSLTLALAIVWWPNLSSAAPAKAQFLVKAGDSVSPYPVMSAFVLPGELLSIETIFEGESSHPSAIAAQGTLTVVSKGRWQWRAPNEPGLYPLSVIDDDTRAAVILNAFVLVPFERLSEGAIRGYKIGTYPPKSTPRPSAARRSDFLKDPPEGFVEVTRENQDTFVSPHFRLEQFLCKQAGSFPKYVVLRSELLLKLESILERVNEDGHEATTLHVMSGYRTPAYNHAIGNVRYSHHQWGSAADIFVDVDRDGRMDDLDGDRKIDLADARRLTALVEMISADAWQKPLVGGLSPYPATASHGPFVHVDVRGYPARW